jgi:hypothetical protein
MSQQRHNRASGSLPQTRPDPFTELAVAAKRPGCATKVVFQQPVSDLFLRFRNRYLEKTGNRQIPEGAAPYLAFRGLVMVSPVWYPNLSEIVSRRLMAFIVAVLERSAFDPREAWGRARVRLAGC